MTEERCEYGNSSYESVSCDLLVGHAGLHSFSIEWETEPYDVCLDTGHVWGRWRKFQPPSSAFSLLTQWKVEPSNERRCKRCGHWDYRGGKREPDITDALLSALYTSPNLLGAINLAPSALTMTWAASSLEGQK